MSRILVVDNDDGNADVMSLILKTEKHEVVTLSGSCLLSSTIANFSPQLIVMDILLDDSDGRVLSNLIKADLSTMHIPILLITAMLESGALAIKCDAEQLMFKPFDYSVFTRKVEEMIQYGRK